MVKKKNIIICLFIILILLLILILCFSKSNKQNKSNQDKSAFLKEMTDVSYIELSYGNENKKLDNQLSKILNNIDNNSIEQHNLSISDDATGVEPYSFIFYNKNDEELYRILFTEGFTEDKNEINIFTEKDSEIIDYYINNENVMEYVMRQVEEFNKEIQ